MSTTMNFSLSSKLQSSLGSGGANNGVYVYAVAYEGSPSVPVTSTGLWANGALGTMSITLPSPSFAHGVVYVLVEQAGAGHQSQVAGLLSNQSNISPANAAIYNFSYQLFEATMDGNPADLGDISSVNSFGLASTYEVVFNPSSSPNYIPSQPTTTDSRGFLNSGSSIFSTLEALRGATSVQNFAGNIFPNDAALGLGPAATANQSPWNSIDWHQYVTNLKTYYALDDIEIVSVASGQISNYKLEYVAAGAWGTDYFWLKPDNSHFSGALLAKANTDWIRIPASQLEQAIYVQTTNLEVHQGGEFGPIISGPGFTPNTSTGAIARDLVAGLDAGFFGASGTSPNPLVNEVIDLNQNSNWTTNYSYAGTLNPAGTSITYSNVLNTGGLSSLGLPNSYYDTYAQAIQSSSNAYGYSYGDLLSRGSTNPQIALWDPVLNTNVQEINITLYDTTDTSFTGYKPYTAPYTAPPAGGYHSVLTATGTNPSIGNLIQFGFQFGVGTTTADTITVGPNQNTPIDFRFYAPASPQAGSDGFITLSVTAPPTAPRAEGDWYNFNMVNNGGTWSLVPFTSSGGVTQFNIYGVPVTGDGTTSWYQVDYGAPGAKTIYNIYAESNATTDNITSLVVDHAVAIKLNALTTNGSNWGLDFADGGNLTYDIATLSAPRTSGDINGDGRGDFVFQSTSGNVSAWEMNGLSVLAAGVFPPQPPPTTQVGALGDINGDGRSDIILQDSTTGKVAAWLMDGLSITNGAELTPSPGTAWQLKDTGDIDGDGEADIILQDSTTGQVAVWQMSGLLVVKAGIVLAEPGLAYQVKVTGDLNGDGRADIILQNSTSGDVAVWEMNGLSVIGGGIVGASPGPEYQLKGIGDLNGDSHFDLIFQNSTTSQVAVWEMNGLSVIGGGVVAALPGAYQVKGASDINGDGHADIIFQSSTTGAIAAWEMSGALVIDAAILPEDTTTYGLLFV